MVNSGSLSALVAVVLLAVVECGPSGQKLATCCTTVSIQEIKERIQGYLVQKANPPCVQAVIFQTQSGLFCSYIRAPWVRRKIVEFEKEKARSTIPSTVSTSPSSLLSTIPSTVSTSPSSLLSTIPSTVSTSPSSLLSIITSTASPPSSSTALPSSSSTSNMPPAETLSESRNE